MNKNSIKIKNELSCMFLLMNNHVVFMLMLFLFGIVLAGCEESKRYEISSNDNVSPNAPIFIDSKPLPGGARIFYRVPSDEDVLSIEASYQNGGGETVRFIASYFIDSLDVWGFHDEGEHKINLCAIDRAGNRSDMIEEIVVALEPPVVEVAKSITVLPSFSSIMLKWNNSFMEPVYVFVDFSYTEEGKIRNHSSVFSSYQLKEKQSIDNLLPDENSNVDVSVSVKDKFGNSVLAKTTSIALLTDNELDKTEWTLPPQGFSLGGVIQANGNEEDGDMDEVIDGITEASIFQNYYLTNQPNPWNIIIDLGTPKELSRIVTHQRYTGEQSSSPQGNYYRGDNVLSYNMYIWDEEAQTWEFVSRHDILSPIVKQASDYKLFGDAGDEAFLYPEEPKYSKATRYFRLEAIKGKYISEITLYGKSI